MKRLLNKTFYSIAKTLRYLLASYDHNKLNRLQFNKVYDTCIENSGYYSQSLPLQLASLKDIAFKDTSWLFLSLISIILAKRYTVSDIVHNGGILSEVKY